MLITVNPAPVLRAISALASVPEALESYPALAGLRGRVETGEVKLSREEASDLLDEETRLGLYYEEGFTRITREGCVTYREAIPHPVDLADLIALFAAVSAAYHAETPPVPWSEGTEPGPSIEIPGRAAREYDHEARDCSSSCDSSSCRRAYRRSLGLDPHLGVTRARADILRRDARRDAWDRQDKER